MCVFFLFHMDMAAVCKNFNLHKLLMACIQGHVMEIKVNYLCDSFCYLVLSACFSNCVSKVTSLIDSLCS